jgi:hypothetical protein
MLSGGDRGGNCSRAAPLIEPNAYALSPPPDYATRKAKRIPRHHEVELVGNADGALDAERSASRRRVAHGTVDGAAAELNRARLQYSTPVERSFLSFAQHHTLLFWYFCEPPTVNQF